VLVTEVSHDGKHYVGHNKFYEQVIMNNVTWGEICLLVGHSGRIWKGQWATCRMEFYVHLLNSHYRNGKGKIGRGEAAAVTGCGGP
jgi:hypothetical protein